MVVGNLLISLLRHADRVTSANMAQLVNVIAPIMTEPGGPSWRQTTFFPFATTSRLARGASLDVALSCPGHDTAALGEVDLVDAVATWDATTGSGAVFLVNRDEQRPTRVTIDVSSLPVSRITECTTLSDADPFACNTIDEPERVRPVPNTTAELSGGRVTVVLPPVSWTALALTS